MSLGAVFLNPLGNGYAGSSDEDTNSIVFALRSIPFSLPATLWISRPAHINSDVVVPRAVTLSFAPGAYLAMEDGATLTVYGLLDAGVEGRFDLSLGGTVNLFGDLPEIHAAWWIGTPMSALRSALNTLWQRYLAPSLSPSLPGPLPAPIVLQDGYLLDETLDLSAPGALPESRYEVVLRGRWRSESDPATFIARSGSVSPLIFVDERTVLHAEHIGFDMTRKSLADQVAIRFASEVGGSRVEACGFVLGAGIGIQTVVRDASLTPNVKRRLDRVGPTGDFALKQPRQFIRSLQRPRRLDVVRSSFIADDGESAIGIDLGGTPTMLTVSDCSFRGSYRVGIDAMVGDLQVVATVFDNGRPGADLDANKGIDIRLGPLAPFTSVEWVDVPRAQLTVTHCCSTSPTFLSAQPVFPGATSRGGAVLTNVLHTPVAEGAPSVFWSCDYLERSLTLQGCEFGSDVQVETRALSGVVDLGTRFAMRDGRPAGFIGAGAGAVVTLETLFGV